MAGVTGVGDFSTRLLARSLLSSDTMEMGFERPAGFNFVAGQGIRLSRAGLVREYSLTSGPEDERLSLCIQIVEKGPFTRLLAGLEIGSSLSFSGPHGYFTFQHGPRPAIFVATGTGIAPFVSMVRAGVKGFTLLQGASTMLELHYRQMIQPAAAAYFGCVSREAAEQAGPSWRYEGRVTDFLRKSLRAGVYDFYLCGRREMVRDAVSIIDDKFPGSRVFFEIFF